jgi:hypothetical protein
MPFDKCPNCGYTDKPQGTPMRNVMSHYVNADKPEEQGILNHNAERHTTEFLPQGQTEKIKKNWVRKDIWDKEQAAKAKAGNTQTITRGQTTQTTQTT